jgi:predicted Zn-dependent protease
VEETYGAGIDPAGISAFFGKLMKLHESEATGMSVLFTTHPPTNERIENVKEDVKALPIKKGLRKDSKAFQRIKAKVSAYLKSKPREAAKGS